MRVTIGVLTILVGMLMVGSTVIWASFKMHWAFGVVSLGLAIWGVGYLILNAGEK